MTYDHNYTTHQEPQTEFSKRDLVVCEPLMEKRGTKLVLSKVGVQFLKPGRTGIVTVTGFLMESDIMRCLSSKSIYVGVLLHDFRRETEAENSAFRKTEIKEIFRCSTFPSSNIKNSLEHKRHPWSPQGGNKKFFHTGMSVWLSR